jgi:hypothetical protein
MTLYLLLSSPSYSETQIHGIFESEEKAKLAMEIIIQRCIIDDISRAPEDKFQIVPMELNQPWGFYFNPDKNANCFGPIGD